MTRYSVRKQNRRLKVWLAFLVALVFVLVIALSVVTQRGAERSSDVQNYDWACLTEPHQNPLEECKK
jgi:hypothetical protein